MVNQFGSWFDTEFRRSSSAKTVVLLFLLCILALGLRLIKLDSPIWGDEVMSWHFAYRPSVLDTLQVTQGDSTPQLYYVLVHYSLPLFGDSTFGLRLPSVLLGVLAVPLTYLLMREIEFTQNEGLWAAALVAFSSILIFYSQEARMYALLIFLSLLSFFALLRCLRKPGVLNTVVYLGLMILISLTHRYGLFLSIAQVACFAAFRRWKAMVAPLLTLVLLVSVVAYRFATGATVPGGSGRPVDGTALLSLINTLTVGTIGMQDLNVLPWSQLLAFPQPTINYLLPIAGALVFGVILLGGALTLKGLSPTQRQGFVMLWICVTIPIALDLLAGSPLSPMPQWLLRAIIYVWPLFYMLTVIISRRLPGRSLLLTAVIVLNLLALYPYFTCYTRFDDTPALESLSETATDDDLIIVDPWYMHAVLRYYYRDHPPMIGFGTKTGWVDVDLLDTEDVYGKLAPPEPFPIPQGKIYVYPNKGHVTWLETFPNTPVYRYDLDTATWQPLEP